MYLFIHENKIIGALIAESAQPPYDVKHEGEIDFKFYKFDYTVKTMPENKKIGDGDITITPRPEPEETEPIITSPKPTLEEQVQALSAAVLELAELAGDLHG
ncbi:MAG: hypothetical protein FWE74_05760 [Oscillospiraceae bacterium]|nr:hypothetical protein [Oscillospiraceae bacterium]